MLVSFGAKPQENDRRWIESLLEARFSGGDHDVRISGYSGGLCSTLAIERMEIADRAGVCLTSEKVEITLRRSALFLRRFDMPRLSVKRLTILRRPASTDTGILPAPETGSFQLPDFSWTIAMRDVQIEQLELEPAVFGCSILLGMDGRGTLGRRLINIELDVEPVGNTEFSAVIDGEVYRRSGRLATIIALNDGAGGPVAQMLGADEVTPVCLADSGEGRRGHFEGLFWITSGKICLSTCWCRCHNNLPYRLGLPRGHRDSQQGLSAGQLDTAEMRSLF